MDEGLTDIPVGELVYEGVAPTGIPPAENIPSGNDLIDATQSVIIDAAENVTQVFDKTDITPVNTLVQEPFYTEVEFWVGMAFVLAVLVLLKPMFKLMKAVLQGRIQQVITDIDEAVRLRDDAQILLAKYERQATGTQKEVDAIQEETQQHLLNLKKYETSQMKNQLKIKEKDLRRHLEAETAKIRQEIQGKVSRRATFLAQKTIENYIKETDKSTLIDQAINELEQLI